MNKDEIDIRDAPYVDNSLKITLLITVLFFVIMNLVVYRSTSQLLINSFPIFLYLFVCFFFINLFQGKQYKAFKIAVFLSSILFLSIITNIYIFRIRQHLELGQTYLKVGKYKLAAQEIKQAIAHPGYFNKETLCLAHFNLIWLYLDTQHWDEANQELLKLWLLDRDNKIIKLDQDPKGTYYYAFCYDKKNVFEETVKRYLKTLTQYPVNHTIHYRLAQIYLQNNNLDEAFYHCNEAIKLLPMNAAYVELLGTVYVYKGDPVAAAEKYKEALDLEPSNKTNLLRLAYLYSTNLFKKEEGLILAKKLVKKYPFDSSTHRILALAYRINLRDQEALREYRFAVRFAPKDADLRSECEQFLKELANRRDEHK